MKRSTSVRIAAAGPLVAWLAFGCSSSSETPLSGPSAGGTAQSGGTNTGGLLSQTGGAASGGTATGDTSSGGTSVGGTSSGGKATGGTSSTGGSATGGTVTGGTTSVGGTSSGGIATGGTTNTGGASTGGTPATGGKASTGGTSTGGTSTGGTSTGGTSGGSTGTPGCNGNTKPSTSPSNGYLTIDVNGTSRQYMLELPTGYDGKTPQPVLFAFHGTESNAQDFIGNSGYGNVSQGAAGRFILVGPMGLSRNGQTGWLDFSSGSGIAQVDIDFFDALVTQLKANYCVDTSRIFSMGHSAGGFISNQLGCVRSNVLRGIGPVAGGGPEGSCGGKVAAIVLHNPKEGDPAECAKMSGGTCPWVVKWADSGWPTVQFWTKQNGCSSLGTMPTTAFSGNPPCQAYAGCDPNYPVSLCLYDYSDQWDGPHAFPVQWGAKAIADFFLALPK